MRVCKRGQSNRTGDSHVNFGPGCPFIDGSKMEEGRWLTEGRLDLFIDVPLLAGTSEDCLYLNVWKPIDADKEPVMVWLQPTGAASTPFFDGSSFARDGIVFVSFDFRQLSLGNFAHPALTAEAGPNTALGHFQTLDQLAALRWVENNIALSVAIRSGSRYSASPRVAPPCCSCSRYRRARG